MSNIFQQPPYDYDYKVGLASILDSFVQNTSITGAQTNLVYYTLNVPENVLVRDGQLIHLRATGIIANATGNLSVRMQVNGVPVINGTKGAAAGTSEYLLESFIYRRNANSFKSVNKIWFGIINNSSTPGAITPVVNALNITPTQSNALLPFTLTLDLTQVAGDSFNHQLTHAVVI